MQKKQIIQFSLLLAAILVLAGAYFGIRRSLAGQEAQKEQEEADAVVTVTSFRPEDISAISYDYDGKRYEFQKDAKEWQWTDDDSMSLDQDAFQAFLEDAGGIVAEEKVEVQEGTDYGFKEPSRTVSVTTENGTSSLIFGSKNEMLGQYYLKTSEGSDVYLVAESVYTAFDKEAGDFEMQEEQAE